MTERDTKNTRTGTPSDDIAVARAATPDYIVRAIDRLTLYVCNIEQDLLGEHRGFSTKAGLAAFRLVRWACYTAPSAAEAGFRHLPLTADQSEILESDISFADGPAPDAWPPPADVRAAADCVARFVALWHLNDEAEFSPTAALGKDAYQLIRWAFPGGLRRESKFAAFLDRVGLAGINDWV